MERISREDSDARALRESEERFRALAEAAREAILIHEHGVSDVVMPGESGPSLMENVAKLLGRVVGIQRLSANRPEGKVLFVSGYPGDDISRRGSDEASFRFLAKPYSSEQLAQRVSQELDD